MSLLFQFLIVAILPASFVVMAVYAWRSRDSRPKLSGWWMVTLLAAAVWASSLLTAYLGIDVDVAIRFTWRVVGQYALSLVGVLMLITTARYLTNSRQLRLGVILSLAFWGGALAVDPTIVPYDIPTFTVADYQITHFVIWGITWVVSALFPLTIAWIVTERVNHSAVPSLHRNQIRFWFMAISLFTVGSVLALVRDLIAVQQIGAIVLLLAALAGTFSVTREYVPDLQTVIQSFFFRVVRGLTIFFVAWLSLIVLTRFIANVDVQESILVLAAALLAISLLVVIVVIDWFSAKLVGSSQEREDTSQIIQEVEQVGSLLLPTELSSLFLDWLKLNMGQEQAWIVSVLDGPAGKLIFRPLSAQTDAPEPAALSDQNPFVEYLRQSHDPLTHQDLDSLPTFSSMAPTERMVINGWQCSLYVPIYAQQRLIALAGLTEKNDEEPYHTTDFEDLRLMADQFGRLLLESQRFDVLQQVNRHVFTQNKLLANENRRLAELVSLHNQFTALMSPDLREPFVDLEMQLVQIQNKDESNSLNGSFDTLHKKATAAQAMVDNLIAVASRLEKQTTFSFKPLHIDSVIRSAIKSLEPMAEARKIRVEFNIHGKLLSVNGDERRLTEAVQQLLHNALKFNKLKSEVTITCEMESNEIKIQVIDHGVGIPPNRMGEIWSGMHRLFDDSGSGTRRLTRVGLPLTRFIVQSHGGRLEARSTYGMGSTFTIYLPALLTREE